MSKQRKTRPKQPKPRSEHRRGMQRVYTWVYRRKLTSSGIPDRRTVAEEVMRIIIRSSLASSPSPERSNAREILKKSGLSLLSQVDRNGENRYTRKGILQRWQRLCRELEEDGRAARILGADARRR